MFTYDPGFLSTASCSRPSPTSTATRASCCTAATPSSSWPPTAISWKPATCCCTEDLPNVASQKDQVHQARDQPHHGQRADAVLPAWLPSRCAPDGHHDRPGGRPVGLLPRQHRHQQPRAPQHLGHPPDRQDAHAGGHGLQVQRGPALHVPQERPQLCGQLPAHDVCHALRDYVVNPVHGARAGPHLHPARRPRAERVHLHRAPVRQLGHQPVCGHRGRCGLPVGPGPRRRQ
jgi:hypothetical protein